MPKVSLCRMLETTAGNFRVCTNIASGKEESDFYLSQQGQTASSSMLTESDRRANTKGSQWALPLRRDTTFTFTMHAAV